MIDGKRWGGAGRFVAGVTRFGFPADFFFRTVAAVESLSARSVYDADGKKGRLASRERRTVVGGSTEEARDVARGLWVRG